MRFFAHHLREFGWDPIVITTDHRYYVTPVDSENDCLLPDGLRVVRTAAVPQRISTRLGVSDIGLRSLWYHWRVLRRLCARGELDAIVIPVPPYIPMVLGRLLHRRYGVPYVVDYIDPWVSNYYASLPRAERPGGYKWRVAQWLARTLEPFALRNVSHVVGVATGYLDGLFERYPWIRQEDSTEIPYGGEPADFDYVRRHPHPNPLFDPADGLIHVSSVGRAGADMVPVLRAIFAAIALGQAREPDVFNRLRVHFAGTTYAPPGQEEYQVLPIAREVGVENVVDEHPGRLSYLDAIQVQLDSHAMLAVGSELPYYTASKIFPLVLAERPIVAVFHEESTVVKILRDTGAGEAITFRDRSELESKVEDIVEAVRFVLQLPVGSRRDTNWEAFEEYTARAMARRLAHILDCVVEREPFSTVPGGK